MIDLKTIPITKEDLDSYEVQNLFQSWSFQPPRAPLRIVGSKVEVQVPESESIE